MSDLSDTNTMPSVLIVDDFLENRLMLRKVFEDEYRIYEADNGEDALTYIRAHSDELSLILLDLFIPKLDGFKVLANMRYEGILQKVPVMVITVDSDRDTEVKALELGASDIITKPYDVRVLKRRARIAVASNRSRLSCDRDGSGSLTAFVNVLSSKDPTPGGGGASALTGALAASLCSMVGNLTSGKKKYAEYQNEIEAILEEAKALITDFTNLIRKDGEAFLPLSQAYSIPKDAPDRDERLEAALKDAAAVPIEILEKCLCVTILCERLFTCGSRLVLSDAGVAAALCRAAAEGAALNVLCNTKLMLKRDYASSLDEKTNTLLNDCIARCNTVYNGVTEYLKA